MIIEKRRKFNFKKMSIALAFIFCNCFFISAMADPYSQAKNNKQVENNGEQVTDGIKNSKTAKPTGVDGEYEIELKVSSETTTNITPVDILLIMDTSASMKNDFEGLKKVLKDFVEKILNPDEGVKNSKISVIEFGENKRQTNFAKGSLNDAKVLCDFSGDYNNIVESIESAQLSGNTNTEAAWLLANEQMQKCREGSKKYILFFTDGVPNRIVGESSTDKKKAMDRALVAYEQVISKYKDVKAYSIGLMKNIMDATDYIPAKNFLKDMQNQGEPYYIEDKDSWKKLKEVYDDIANNIIKESILANNSTITDEVTKEFEIVNNGADAKVYKPLEDGNLEEIDIKPTVSGNKLSWNLGSIGTEGIIIRFKIKLKDEYYGIGDDKIPTNVQATMDYKDLSGADKTITFQRPTVSVPYKQGKITIIKEVRNNIGLTAPRDDNFSISLIGKENLGEYSINLKGGETKTLNFTLKHSNADILPENLKNKDFLNIGEYDIREIVPMNYYLEGIYIYNSNTRSYEKTNKFIIDNTNNNITIKVVNKYVNDKYFYDKDEKENVLELKR